MSDLQIYQFPCRVDNYGVLIHDANNQLTASIDAPDAGAVEAALKHKGWQLTHILTTHHHGDHTAGNTALKTKTDCTIYGPKGEAAKIPSLDIELSEGDTVGFGDFDINVLDTPGHTIGHISYVIPAANVAFVGDTMFAMGCGRLFEGTPQMMWSSLRKLIALPPQTKIYCGHEYTQGHAKFALTIEPHNEALKARAQRVNALRKLGEPTVPTTIGEELETNPFVRVSEASVRERLGLRDADDWEVFAKIRERKDNF